MIILAVAAAVALMAAAFKCSGDAGKSETESVPSETVSDSDAFPDEERILETCRKGDGTESTLLSLFEEEGFPAADSGNAFDPVNMELLREFCRKVREREEGSLTLIAVDGPQRIIRYGFETSDGKVAVHKTWYDLSDDEGKTIDSIFYEADTWNEGRDFLVFSGSFDSELLSVLTLSEGAEYDAIRMSPQDPMCRKAGALPILNIGYGENNIFISDWDEKDHSQLDTDDIFAYSLRQNRDLLEKYTYEEDSRGNLIYYVPQKDYEDAVCSVIDIGAEELRKKDTYNPCFGTYCYRHRTSDEAAGAGCPFMNVLSCEESADGDLTLCVSAVYEEMGTETAATSEVKLKKTVDGYLIASNRVLEKEEENLTWYVKRQVTETSFAGDFVITSEDISRLDSLAMDALGSVSENDYGRLEGFYHDYEAGKESEAEVFLPYSDGSISLTAFIHRNGKVNTYFAHVERDKGGSPTVTNTSVNIVDSMVLTEKGYFIYGLRYLIEHASLRNYWRIKPLPKDCEALTDKYIWGMDFQKYKLFITDWDESNAEDMLMDGMFDDFYWKATGKVFKTEGNAVDAELFEDIMTSYLPVTAEELRRAYEYDPETESYAYRRVYAGSPNAPAGEVVKYAQNPDGSIDLTVDGLWLDFDSDLAFRCFIKVKPGKDGRFMYMSNKVVPMELSVPKLSIY